MHVQFSVLVLYQLEDEDVSEPKHTEIIHDVAEPSPSPETATADRTRAKWKMRSRSGPFLTSADLCDVWTGNTREVETLTPNHFDDLVVSIASVGQQVPVIARVGEADILSGRWVVRAAPILAIHLARRE